MRTIHHITAGIFASILSLPVIVGSLCGQPSIDIRLVRPQTDFYYRIHLGASCGGRPVTDLVKQQISITQDDIPVIPFNYFIYRRPPLQANACFNAGLVFDRSNRLSPNGSNTIAAAARRFIDSMSLECHQATVISYSSTIDIHEFLTSDTARLRSAATLLAAPGTTRTHDLIDGIQAAMTEIDIHGKEQLRVVVAFTTGGDNLTAQRIDDLVASMRYAVYRLFIVTTAPAADSVGLERLARLTGGRVIRADSTGELPDIFGSLAGFFLRDLDEYQIVYQSPRTYPPPKTLNVGIAFCNDSTTATYSFQGLPTAVHPMPAPGALRLTSFPQPLHPASTILHLRLSVEPASLGSTVVIWFSDMLGRRIASIPTRTVQNMESELAVTLPHVSPGLYICHATVGVLRTTLTILVSE